MLAANPGKPRASPGRAGVPTANVRCPSRRLLPSRTLDLRCVRYVDHSIPGTGQAYVVSILDSYSRAILASAVTLSQDTNAYLSVLHAAIERHGEVVLSYCDRCSAGQ